MRARDDDSSWIDYVWLVYLMFFFFQPYFEKASARDWAVAVAGAGVFVVLYVIGVKRRGRDLLLITLAILAIGIIYLPFNCGALCFFIYAAGFAGNMTPLRFAGTLIVAFTAIAIVECWIISLPLIASWPVIFVVLIGGINIHYAEKHRANARLRVAHDEIEHLAKVAERERIARDLHDLLGHTLSVIILKSELASKLADRDPQRAGDEIRDVERISRDALAQVRAAVRGYRSRGLAEEIAAAREALGSAGVTTIVDVTALPLAPAQEAVVALAVREATTNIVRHSRATACRITSTIGEDACIVTIHDNGAGGDAPFGSGLTGMRERIEMLGGTLARDGDGGTTLRITLPLLRDVGAQTA